MMRRVTVGFVFVFILVLVPSCNDMHRKQQTKDNNILSVFQVQTEAQADGTVTEEEDGPEVEDGGDGGWSGWKKGYEPKQVAIKKGGSCALWFSEHVGGNIGITWEYIWCCIRVNTEMIACSTGMEDNKCGHYRNNL